jgi:zinc transporter ZupT
MNYLLPFLSVILGYTFALFVKPKKKKNIKLLLAFSGAFLLSLTVIHLLPDVYKNDNKNVGVFIIIGILFQIVLEFFSQGAEHGHVHGHQEMQNIPWSLFISLCIHAFLEGFPVNNDNHLAVGIAVHHLPIAITLTSFLMHSKLKPTAIFIFIFVFSLMTPLGTYCSDFYPIINQYHNQITGIVIGILFHISSTIIFESSEGHRFNVAKISMIILGFLVAYFI